MAVLKRGSFDAREYQRNIAEAACERNTLVVLPTGMGKTLISVLVAADRLEKFPDSKVLVTAPTRPLNAQHKKSFESFTNVLRSKIVLVTGKTPPAERREIYEGAKVVVATPQTIENDLAEGRLSLRDFSFLTFDESHRAGKDYAYTKIAKSFMIQSKNPLILALTASPGGNESKIRDICENLFIRAVEVRSESDEDVKEHVKEIEKEFVYVDFPEDFARIRSLLEEVLKEDMQWLNEKKYVPTTIPSRQMLISLQNRMSARYSATRNYIYIWPIMRAAEAIKISHAMELIETQGVPFLIEYLEKTAASTKKTDQRMMKQRRVVEAFDLARKLHADGLIHPKIDKIVEMVSGMVERQPKVKIIVFANFRAAVDRISKILNGRGVPTEVLVGQAVKNGRGMTQDQQVDVLQRFRESEFNVLCGTSVSEEGIDVPSVDYAIFYEAVPSEIRSIQRRGRVGRQSAGRTIFLITKGTRDQAYFFASMNKERKMKGVLRSLKKSGRLERKKTLVDWVVE